MTNCVICGVEAKQKCAGCSSAFYCSRDHQILDWKNGHKTVCKPYEVSSSIKLSGLALIKLNFRSREMTNLAAI